MTENGFILNDFSALSGATITFNLKQAVGSTPTGGKTKFYLADFGDETWFVVINSTCSGPISPVSPA